MSGAVVEGSFGIRRKRGDDESPQMVVEVVGCRSDRMSNWVVVGDCMSRVGGRMGRSRVVEEAVDSRRRSRGGGGDGRGGGTGFPFFNEIFDLVFRCEK